MSKISEKNTEEFRDGLAPVDDSKKLHLEFLLKDFVESSTGFRDFIRLYKR